MNELRDLVITVDGYSVDKTGFEITEAHKENGDTWSLTVKAYKRKGEDFFSESSVSMLTLVDRIENKYGTHNNKWTVVKIEEFVPGSFKLIVKKATDEKEYNSDKEEHVEDKE